MKNNKGFTLVELMVVLLIIGILIAVAVPVFLGARTRAQNNVANQAMTNAARAVAAEYAAEEAMPSVGFMSTTEPSYTWTTNASSGPSVINYTAASGRIEVKSDAGSVTAVATVDTTNGSITKTEL